MAEPFCESILSAGVIQWDVASVIIGNDVVKPSWVDAVGTTVRNSAQHLSSRLAQAGSISGRTTNPSIIMGASVISSTLANVFDRVLAEFDATDPGLVGSS